MATRTIKAGKAKNKTKKAPRNSRPPIGIKIDDRYISPEELMQHLPDNAEAMGGMAGSMTIVAHEHDLGEIRDRSPVFASLVDADGAVTVSEEAWAVPFAIGFVLGAGTVGALWWFWDREDDDTTQRPPSGPGVVGSGPRMDESSSGSHTPDTGPTSSAKDNDTDEEDEPDETTPTGETDETGQTPDNGPTGETGGPGGSGG